MRLQLLVTAVLTAIVLALPAMADETPEPLAGMSVPVALPDMSVQGASGTETPSDENGLQAEYYTQKMSTVEGVITAVDLDKSTITIKDADAERTFYYDELTRFQVRLKPVEPSDLKTGSKIAGLYRESEDSLYISRVVVILGEKASKRKSKRRRRRR